VATPTLHGGRVEPPREVEAEVSDNIPIGELKVSEELKTILSQVANKPNLVAVLYTTRNEVKVWWQTRKFPDEAVDVACRLLHKDMSEKLLGKTPPAEGIRNQLAQHRRPLNKR